MSTNYYAKVGISDNKYHIGKSSVGWRFIFSTDLGDDIYEVFDHLDCVRVIEDEYGNTLTVRQMKKRIMATEHLRLDYGPTKEGWSFIDDEFC